MASAMPANELVAGLVFQAIREDRFHILTHAEYKPSIVGRMSNAWSYLLQPKPPINK